MNIDELRSAQSKERQKSDLQQLRESFYADVAEYVTELEEERDRAAERAEDPFGSPEVQQLTNDIETAKDTAEAIYERRLGKIVKKASLVSAEMANPDDVNGLTSEEQALFADLVDRIEENKAHMLDVIAGEAEAGAPGLDDASASADESASAAADARSAADASSTANATSGRDRTTQDAPGSDGRDGPHPEDGLGAEDPTAADATSPDAAATDADGSNAGDRDADPRRSEAAAVAGDDDATGDDATGDDATGADATGADATGEDDAAGGPDASVSAADLMGGDGPDEPADAADDAATRDGTTDASEMDDAASGDDAAGGDDADRVTLRVTRDVGEIFGVDEREYRLDAEDVVTLPEENADVLVSQDAAERLD